MVHCNEMPLAATLCLCANRVSATLASFALVGTSAVAVTVFGGSQALAGSVRCGDTITADTTLDADLLGRRNNGIVIGADNIVPST
jgi:hypothetical protein